VLIEPPMKARIQTSEQYSEVLSVNRASYEGAYTDLRAVLGGVKC